MKLFQIFNKATQPGQPGQPSKAPAKAWRGKVFQGTPARPRDTTATADLRQVLSQRPPAR